MNSESYMELEWSLIQIYFETERYEDAVNAIKKVIQIRPILNSNEQNIFSMSYDLIVHFLFVIIESIQSKIESELLNEDSLLVDKLIRFKSMYVDKLLEECNDIIVLIDEKLLPFSPDNKSTFLYENNKAKYYKILCTFSTENMKKELVIKAQESYEKAINLVKKEYDPYSYEYQKMFYFYTLFLNEILGQKNEAVKVAKKAVNDIFDAYDKLTEEDFCTYSNDRTYYLQSLSDNIKIWEQEINIK